MYLFHISIISSLVYIIFFYWPLSDKVIYIESMHKNMSLDDNLDDEKISLDDGAGGEKMEKLIKEIFLPAFKNEQGEIPLEYLDDSAVIDDIVFTIDGHTVKPIFFPGGDLGKLAVAGTINDLLSIGAKPVALSSALVLPEGFSMSKLKRLIKSTAETAKKAEVPIVTGDTKVVEKEDLDEPIMTTSGIGKRHPLLDQNLETAGGRKTRWLSDNNLNPGDDIILTGSVGDHGITVLSEREGYGFQGQIMSDVEPLVDIVHSALGVGGIAAVKDPTRGGLANALNEWSSKSEIGIEVYEEKIPIKKWVSAASEMLGIDPLSIGNEGKMIMAVNQHSTEKVLSAIKETENGRYAAVIGKATEDIDRVVLKTEVGGARILEEPVGDPVPRIC